MSDSNIPLSERLAALSPEKRKILEERLRAAGRLPAADPPPAAPAAAAGGGTTMDFSVFFFSSDGSKDSNAKYRLPLETARFADQRGFRAVWVPERHFQPFGGLYPNPSVLAAALATLTENVQIRAGSVVLPLHHPVRVAEEWSVVDNLSGGRAAISIASGWHPNDFLFQPQNYDDRRDVMFRNLETIRRLWAGEKLSFPGGAGDTEVSTLPRPIQAELPVWVTTTSSTQTIDRAGEVGANLLASIGSQTLDDLKQKIDRYRDARRRGGHDPVAGIVSLMLHTFIGEDADEVKGKVREPLSDYLRTYLKQREDFVEAPGVTEADKQALMDLAFEHYIRSASLIGTPESCARMVRDLAGAGVDEIACLVDFGLELDEVLASLEHVSGLVEQFVRARR